MSNAVKSARDANALSKLILDAAFVVHTQLGPGLLESAYQRCLEFELLASKLRVRHEVELPIVYRGNTIDCGYRMDLLVEELVIVEVKAVERLAPIHTAQVMSYLRLSGKELGLLLNFNVPHLREGIKRVVNGLKDPS